MGMQRLCWLSAIAGLSCSTAPAVDCNPQCAAGYHCDNGACLQDSTGTDGSMGDGGGACAQACSGLTPHCNAGGHCVGCTSDMQCPQGHYCKVQSDTVANCTIGCMSDDRCGGGTMKCCNMQCVDSGSDPLNCGQCGKACSGMHQSATCNNGVCAGGACDPGWGDCDGNPANGCEANLHVDSNNCTACGMKCALTNSVVGCADGCYIAACQFGWADCNNNEMDGCETSVLSDPQNCGGCGQPCKGLPNATANCSAGNCILGNCNMGYANCDGNPMNGCESNLSYDPKNCGKCGNVCPMNLPGCNMGQCSVALDFGPMHTFVNLTTDHYITQGCCSVGCMGNKDVDAAYFCTHFYGQRLNMNCTPLPGYTIASTPNPTYPKMHKDGGCTQNGSDIPMTTCDPNGNDSACKIGNWAEITSGLVNLVCHCQ